MVNGPEVSTEEIKRIAERALLLQRYLLKKAWGVCYAIWATQLVAIFWVPALFFALGFVGDLEIVTQITLNVTFNIAGLVAVLWIFKRVRDTQLVRQAVTKSTGRKRQNALWVAFIFVVYYLIVAVSFVFLRPHAEAVLSILLTTTIPSLYYGLKASFQKEVPQEGVVSLIFYGFSTTASLATAFLNITPSIYPLLWAPTIVVLLLASLCSQLEKPPRSLEDRPK
jgi:hypothetical protein